MVKHEPAVDPKCRLTERLNGNRAHVNTAERRILAECWIERYGAGPGGSRLQFTNLGYTERRTPVLWICVGGGYTLLDSEEDSLAGGAKEDKPAHSFLRSGPKPGGCREEISELAGTEQRVPFHWVFRRPQYSGKCKEGPI